MAGSRRNAWLLLPMLGAVGLVAWFALSSGHGTGTSDESGEGGARDAAAPGAVEGPGGTLAASPGGAKKPAKADEPEAIAAPTFTKAEGVFGRILDSHEKPIPAAKVSLFLVDPTAMWGAPDPAPAATATSGPDGAYLVGPAPLGRLRVRAEAQGYAATVQWVASRGACVDLILDRGGSLRLHAKEPGGAPVKGAELRFQSGMTTTRGTTGESGEALLEALPTGQGSLRVVAKGRAAANLNDVFVESGKVIERTVVLGGGIPVTGRAMDDATGAGLAGVEITAKLQWDPYGSSSPTAKTDADGRFTIEGAGSPNDWIQVQGTKEGYLPSSSGVRLQAAAQGGAQEVLLKLARGETPPGIAGSVLDAEGKAAPGATVVYVGMPRASTGGVAPTATANAAGEFELALPPGTGKEWSMFIGAAAPGRGVGAAQVTHQRPQGVTVRLAGAGIVAGKVTGVGDAPLEGANVSLTFDWNSKVQAAPGSDVQPWMMQQLFYDQRLTALATSTDASGTFRIEGVPAASFRLDATWGLDRGGASEAVSVRAGGTETVNLTLGNGKTIEGRVLDSSAVPVPGAYVNGWDPTNRDPMGSRSASYARSDADGVFKIRNVMGDRWQLSVFASGFASQNVPNVSAGDRTVEVKLVTLGWIEGQVLADGAPYAGSFGVTASFAAANTGGEGGASRGRFVSNGGMSWDGGNQREETFSSADGRFTMRGVTAGPWKLNVTTQDGWVPSASVEVAVSDGRAAGPVEIRLVRGAIVTGTLSEDGSPDPVSGANVSLRIKGAPETGGQSWAWSTTDAKGRWSASGLAGGTWVLTVTTPQGLSMEEEVRLSAGQTLQRDLVALRFGSLTIRVVDAEGRAVEGANVTLMTDRGTFVQPNWDLLQKQKLVDFTKPNTWQRIQTTDAQGVNQRWHVPPGRINVKVNHAPTAAAGTGLADVSSDRNTEATITIAAPGVDGAAPGK